jgi:hypothetical protein
MSDRPDMQVEEARAEYLSAVPGTAQAGTTPLPEQKAFFKIPARFGHVPVAEEPLGYDRERRFERHYPRIELPFQLVDTVETGVKKRYKKGELFPNGLNRLFSATACTSCACCRASASTSSTLTRRSS